MFSPFRPDDSDHNPDDVHVFEIRGVTGFITLIVGAILAVACVTIVPAAVVMVFWNAFVFETFQGPEIQLHQGFLIWTLIVLLIKLFADPQIHFEFKQLSDLPGDLPGDSRRDGKK
ncbi:MAG: hypothetical protein K2X01_03060 [Cyanobacteria bacterium]|nr:hypothetical protein [Cyanobacteriota bacterium]